MPSLKELIFSHDLRPVLTGVIAIIVGLFVGLYVNFYATQREQSYRLLRSVEESRQQANEISLKLERLEEAIEDQQDTINGLNLEVFTLKCSTSKGTFDYNQKICTVGDLKQQFKPTEIRGLHGRKTGR